MSQARSRERVKGLGEVFTAPREVNAMLDLVPGMFPSAERPDDLDRRFLEPACGSGNFLAEILARKLAWAGAGGHTGRGLEHRVLRCLASVYGVDIDPLNVQESRARMEALAFAGVGEGGRTAAFVAAVEVILGTNVVEADFLAGYEQVAIVLYESSDGLTFTRSRTMLAEMINPA